MDNVEQIRISSYVTYFKNTPIRQQLTDYLEVVNNYKKS